MIFAIWTNIPWRCSGWMVGEIRKEILVNDEWKSWGEFYYSIRFSRLKYNALWFYFGQNQPSQISKAFLVVARLSRMPSHCLQKWDNSKIALQEHLALSNDGTSISLIFHPTFLFWLVLSPRTPDGANFWMLSNSLQKLPANASQCLFNWANLEILPEHNSKKRISSLNCLSFFIWKL